MKRIALIALILMTTTVVSACNTVEGAGRDITATGQAGKSVINGN